MNSLTEAVKCCKNRTTQYLCCAKNDKKYFIHNYRSYWLVIHEQLDKHRECNVAETTSSLKQFVTRVAVDDF